LTTHATHPSSSVPSFRTLTATTEISTLSLHDALPIYPRLVVHDGAQSQRRRRAGLRVPARAGGDMAHHPVRAADGDRLRDPDARDRKSTRLNSSHVKISYAVFCLKKKKTKDNELRIEK